MSPDFERELIPHSDTVRMINQLQMMAPRLKNAAEQMRLLNDAGHVPAAPNFSALIQHAADAQALSHEVVELTAAFARTAHSTNRAGSAVLAHLATAATLSCFAVPRFAETAEFALSLPRSSGATARQEMGNRMVINHATARAYLRRTSESLSGAVKELTTHLEFHRFFPTPSQRETPAPPSPRPSARHR